MFEEIDEEDYKELPLISKIWKYMSHSSLFIFHETWKLRQFLVLLVVSSDQLTTKMPLNLINETENKDINQIIQPKLVLIEENKHDENIEINHINNSHSIKNQENNLIEENHKNNDEDIEESKSCESDSDDSKSDILDSF